VSATAEEAADLGAIDFVARDLPDLLAQADGKRVEVASGARVLHTRGARIEGLPMNWRERALFPIAHPNVAYILMILGVYGLILELKASGFSGAGILGAICIVLALFALSVLSVNVAGLALVLIGVGFFVAELFAPTHGLLTVGGAAALAVGSLILIDADSVQVSRPLIAGVVLATVVFFVFLLGAVVRGQRRKVVTGREGLIGQVGVARGPLNPEGTVFVDGTLWSAESAEGEVACGEKVEVVAVNGLRLTVRPAPAPGTPDAAQQPCEEGG
jgi:membrane-bound serine protease (ClpP class)